MSEGIFQSSIHLPHAAKILKVGIQNQIITLWVMFDSDGTFDTRSFFVIGTGVDFDNSNLNYLDTVFEDGNVWHVFEQGY